MGIMDSKSAKERKTDALYSVSALSGMILIISSLVLVLFLHKRLNQFPVYQTILYLWLPSALAVFSIKITLAFVYSRLKNRNHTMWLILFYLTTTLSGILFGSYACFLRGISDEAYFFFTFFIIGTLTAGSTGILFADMAAFAVFNILSVLPYSLLFIVFLGGEFTIFGFFLFVYLFTNFINAHRQNRIFKKTVKLSIENESIFERLAQSEEKFSKTFYSGIAPMAMLNFSDAKFIDANNAMLSLLHYSRDSIIGKTPYDLELYRKPEDVIDLISEAYRKKSLTNRELSLVTGDGRTIHSLVTIENIKLNNNIIALVMLQDFTERLEYQRQLKIERDRAEEAAGVKDRFLGMMSHEIRTPMTAILGMTNLAMHTDNPKERDEYLAVVKESGSYLLGLIDDILDMLKLQAGRVEIEPVDLDIREIVGSAHRAMEMLALSKKLEFRYSVSPEVPLYIRSSPERLKQILFNLIGNAIKFTSEGSIVTDVKLSDGEGYQVDTGNTSYLEFSVTDTGIGIPIERHQLIFETFTQADAATFRKYGGTGLGLSICKQMSRLLRGDIKVESEPGKGSTFSFVIPLVHGNKPAVDDEKLLLKAEPEKRRKILFAEDNIMNQKLIRAYMKKLGIDFTLVETGVEVIEKLKMEKFDTVFMDIEMPEMDGHEAMKRIRSGEAGNENSDIPVYAMSAHVLKETINKCIEDGFTGYIIKPLDLKELRRVL